MSQHPSLRVDSVGVKHRNVFKRSERIKKMKEENRWQEGRSAFYLPKIKSMKVKVKKSAETAKQGEAQPAAAAVAAPPAPAEKAKQEKPKQEKAKQEKPKG